MYSAKINVSINYKIIIYNVTLITIYIIIMYLPFSHAFSRMHVFLIMPWNIHLILIIIIATWGESNVYLLSFIFSCSCYNWGTLIILKSIS